MEWNSVIPWRSMPVPSTSSLKGTLVLSRMPGLTTVSPGLAHRVDVARGARRGPTPQQSGSAGR
jgi:hypothetical protein